ncbi:transglutaminase domain-containing protein [Candidatus Microgenomates bacterium]|nr:transglutaminase domain-containing protein [Candidatus Microgenomates bacterium]
MTKKLFTFCWCLLISCWLFAAPSFAKDFSSFYKVTYEFDKNGESLVNQEISLINQASNLYVSQYSLSLIGGKISNVEAYDKIGPLKTKLEQKGETTILTLDFNEQVVGKDKILSFILKYKDSGLAKKEGNLWQISIPKLANSEEIDEFQVLIKVPLEYGKISVINPAPQENKIVNGFYNLSFKKENIINFGVAATFGQYQTFNFKITYQLKNLENSPAIEKIAIPPDTNYQTVFYHSITPEPKDVEIDKDGNWLAFYELGPKEELQIETEGAVDVFPQPKKSEKNSSVDKDYLSNTKYWDVNNKKIADLSSQLKTPESIYKFVVKTLSYDYKNVENGPIRTGGVDALLNPKGATCSQFTDLFISLCRATGIPAREVVGYAYTDNPQLKQISQEADLLHSWPEYFDTIRNEWIAVDPTWGNTTGGLDYFNKFDMAHFAFVVHGKSDTLPLPPGSSMNDELKKSIFITFGEESPKNLPQRLDIVEVSPSVIYSLKNNKVSIQFKNNNGAALYSERMTSPLLDSNPSQWYFERILPFSQFKIEFFLKPKEMFKDYTQELSFTLGENKIRYNIKVKSLLLRSVVFLGGILSAAIIVLLLSIKKTSCKAKEKDAIVQESSRLR